MLTISVVACFDSSTHGAVSWEWWRLCLSRLSLYGAVKIKDFS
jgi:hypothetical protein